MAPPVMQAEIGVDAGAYARQLMNSAGKLADAATTGPQGAPPVQLSPQVREASGVVGATVCWRAHRTHALCTSQLG